MQLLGQETSDMRREESRFEHVYRLTSSIRASRPTSHAPHPSSPFPIRVACEAGVFVSGEGRIRDRRGDETRRVGAGAPATPGEAGASRRRTSAKSPSGGSSPRRIRGERRRRHRTYIAIKFVSDCT